MITSGYGRSAPDTPHPPTPAAQLQPAAISGTSSRIGAVPVPANGHTTSPHKRCAQAPTPINFDHPLMHAPRVLVTAVHSVDRLLETHRLCGYAALLAQSAKSSQFRRVGCVLPKGTRWAC